MPALASSTSRTIEGLCAVSVSRLRAGRAAGSSLLRGSMKSRSNVVVMEGPHHSRGAGPEAHLCRCDGVGGAKIPDVRLVWRPRDVFDGTHGLGDMSTNARCAPGHTP